MKAKIALWILLSSIPSFGFLLKNVKRLSQLSRLLNRLIIPFNLLLINKVLRAATSNFALSRNSHYSP